MNPDPSPSHTAHATADAAMVEARALEIAATHDDQAAQALAAVPDCDCPAVAITHKHLPAGVLGATSRLFVGPAHDRRTAERRATR